MKITVLGSGMVGQTIAAKMETLGHEVTLGTRDVNETQKRTKPNPMTGFSFAGWYAHHPQIKLANYGTSAEGAELIINATQGAGSIEALRAVGKEQLAGKIILDISNPLDFSQGMPPTLFVCNTDSLAEQIQREFPEARVVKSLNTMTTRLMVDPGLLLADHSVMVSGNDKEAKQIVTELLQAMGWKPSNIIDLGDITTARGTEMLLPVWLRLMAALGTAEFNFHIVKK